MRYASQDIYLKDTGQIAIGTKVERVCRLCAIHAQFGTLKLAPCEIALCGTVEAHMDPAAALNADGVL